MTLFYILVAASLITGSIVWFLIKGKISGSIKLFLIGLSFIAIGLFISYKSALKIELVVGKKHQFSETKGVVLKKYIAGERAFHPEIIYQFKLDSVIYKDSTTMDPPMFGGKRKKYDVARTILEDFEIGDSVNVIYNPASPKESYLKLSVKWNQFVILFFGYLLISAGILFLLLFLIRAKNISASTESAV